MEKKDFMSSSVILTFLFDFIFNKNKIIVTGKINVKVPSAIALSFLQNIKNIGQYEPKLTSVVVKQDQYDKGFL